MRVMRTATIALGVFLSLTGGPPALAEGDVQLGGKGAQVRGVVAGGTTTSGRSGGTATSVSRSGGSSGPAAPAPVVTRDKRGITHDYSRVGGGKVRYSFDRTRDYCDFTADYVECFGPRPPNRPGGRGGAPPPPPISPTEIVEQTIVNVRLPQPRPTIDPGHAVTGLKAYLETGNRTSHTFAPIDTVLGPLSISATSTYTVNWGDGTTTGPHSSSGGAYPKGDITHVYQDAQTVDVTVTQNWTARWRLAGQSGTIGGLQSASRIDDFEVREVQAVRRR